MKLKTYQAPTLHAALRLARIELGSEAVLLEAKEREAETAEGRFQVTFALGAGPDGARATQTRVEPPHWKSYLGESKTLAAEGPSEAETQAQEQPAKAKRRSPRKPRSSPAKSNGALEAAPPPVVSTAYQGPSLALRTGALAALFGRLVGAGVTPVEAEGLIGRAAEAAGRDDDAAALEKGLREALDGGWKIHCALEPKAKATRLIALVGPAGAGKSATAVKAARLLLRAYDRPAALVSLGRHPVGGVEGLEAWATLLNLRLEIVESPGRLAEAIERLTAGPRPAGAVVLDTPPDGSAAEALGAFPEVEIHLALPATHSPADMLRAVERFRSPRIDAVVLTRLDEAAAPGVFWGFQKAAGLPASFLGCGPRTPDDLEAATARRLTQRAMGL